MPDSSYSNQLFHVLHERTKQLTALVLNYIPRDKKLSILDLGCGTGEQVLALAEALPQSNFVGLDISQPNIEVAEAKRLQHSAGERVQFIKSDYMQFDHEPFDVIYSWGVLHLVPIPSSELYAKLALDLKPHGLFLNTMPFDCKFNRALSIVRKLLRSVQSPWTDSCLLKLATLIHRGQFEESLLRQRILYMYEPPLRMDSPQSRQEFIQKGIQFVAQHTQPHASFAQMKQNLVCFQKHAA